MAMVLAENARLLATITLKNVSDEIDGWFECPVESCGAELTAGMVAVLLKDEWGEIRVACDEHDFSKEPAAES